MHPESIATEVLKVDADAPEAAAIARAAGVIRRGGLVAFPTETVYGLGADALNASAVGRIFTAKGRPANNPIIVHVADVTEMDRVAQRTALANRLVERFWPGPLTLVLSKRESVPDAVTAGGPTVAVRAPDHPVAHALISAAGVPIAAPSANRSTEISPTRAEHVLKGLRGRIEMVLDGGPTPAGLESTVLDVSTDPPRLLRPGPVSVEEIEAVIGPIMRTAATRTDAPLPSPGMLPRHYAPRAPLECLPYAEGIRRVEELAASGSRVGLVAMGAPALAEDRGIVAIEMPAAPDRYAARLYAALHALDDAGVDRIVVELPPDTDEWLAVRDRLRRASA